MMFENKQRVIGIVGGVGPYAGLDLNKKIFDQIDAKCDQDYVSTILISHSNVISDRTSFLYGITDDNPGESIANVLFQLEKAGANIAGIPCNTSHSAPIFNRIKEKMVEMGCRIALIHMIDEVAKFLDLHYPKVKKIGLLSSLGTYKSEIYQNIFENRAEIVIPDENDRSVVHEAIYNSAYGIKTNGFTVSDICKKKLFGCIYRLKKRNVDAIILGCTELPIAIIDRKIGGTIMIDPAIVLARALLRESNIKHLKPNVI